MRLETLKDVRKRLRELEKDIKEEIGETNKPLHAEAAMQDFPGNTRGKTALYRKLQRAEKKLAEAEEEMEAGKAEEKISDAYEVLKKEDQAYITDKSMEELEDLARKVEREKEGLEG